MMHDALFSYIETKSKTELPHDERALIASKFKLKHLRRKQYLLQEGDVCTYTGFIVKGSARMYSVDEKGHEHIIRFGMEGWWIGDLESFNLLTPSLYNIEMLEDTDLLLITNAYIQQLLEGSPAFNRFVKVQDKLTSIATQKRIHAAISMTVEERYKNLLQNYPQFFQRFPQNMIASYLGTSPETLSRIRSSMRNK